MDIICMSKFLSALTAHRAQATKNLQYVLQHMRPGALLVFCDNSGGGTTEWVTKECLTHGLQPVSRLAGSYLEFNISNTYNLYIY